MLRKKNIKRIRRTRERKKEVAEKKLKENSEINLTIMINSSTDKEQKQRKNLGITNKMTRREKAAKT